MNPGFQCEITQSSKKDQCEWGVTPTFTHTKGGIPLSQSSHPRMGPITARKKIAAPFFFLKGDPHPPLARTVRRGLPDFCQMIN